MYSHAQIDLGEIYRVSKIIMEGRQDIWKGRFRSVQVRQKNLFFFVLLMNLLYICKARVGMIPVDIYDTYPIFQHNYQCDSERSGVLYLAHEHW